MKNRLTAKISIFAILLSAINLLNISVSERALAATAGSGNCVQTINNSSGVSVYETSGYCYVAFKDVGSRIWTVPSNALTMDYLVVAGGGGGGGHHSGGGGAGGLRQAQSVSLLGKTELTLTVGDGGAGGVQTISNNYSKGSNGSASSLIQTAGTGSLSISASGGGGGATLAAPDNANTGGSGGGNFQNIVAAGNAGGFTPVEGYAGGVGTSSSSAWSAGGGGGASEVGKNSTTAGIGGAGGAGQVISWMTTAAQTNLVVGQTVLTSVYFSGGGGGGATNNGGTATGGSGGSGGGGAGTGNATSAATAIGVAGTSNTGGGGGGSGEGRGAVAGTNHAGGKGGSGVVVIRYSIPASTFAASSYTAGSTTWANTVSGVTAGTAPTGGMTKTSSGPAGVVFAGKESSNSDQLSSSIGSTTSLDTVTVEMWLKLKDTGNAQNASGSMLFAWDTSPNNYNIYHYGNQVGFNNFNSQLYGIDSTSYNNAWTHFVFVMTDTGPWASQKIYVNGILQASTCRITSGNCGDAQARSFASTGNFLIMDHPNNANTWNAKGDLGLVRIYNQELSAASVQSLYNTTSPDYTEAPDTTAPTFTSSSAFSAAENISTSATAATIRVSESSTVTISSGADSARFNITKSDTDTAIIKFNTSPDFEAPVDVGGNNVYEITLTATDAAANAGTQSITITVTDVVDTTSFNSLALAGSATSATYRTVVVITANVSVASRVTFRVNGKVLPGCKNKLASGSGSSYSATCSWRPSNRGQVNLTAAATPTGAGISNATANPVSIMVGRRTGTR